MIEVPNPTVGRERDLVIFGVDFGDDYEVLRIRYMLTRNVCDGYSKDETVTIEAKNLDQGDLAEVIDAIVDLVDAANLYNRLQQEKQ